MDTTCPTISAIIPCRNERHHIEACVRSILAQEPVPGGMEIIVADGESDDGTRDILNRLCQEEPCLRVTENPRQITACGMNAGIREARGQYLAIMGAHNRYASDYLRQGVAVLQETEADNVGGAMICEAASYVQSAIAAAHHSPFAVGNARWHNPDYEGPADTVFGGIYRREVFDQIGLFDEELIRNQDDEFNLRLTRAGGKIWQSQRLKSWYTPRASLQALARQYMQYGYWKVRLIQKHRLPASVRHLIPVSFVLSLIVLGIVSPWWPAALWACIALMALYSVCTATAAAWTAAHYGWRLLLLLPFVFTVYHFAYGYGFLRGTWYFMIRRRGPSHIYTTLTRNTTAQTERTTN
jgi:glycosyltransferase involved in cell wall biosynthesis